MIELLHTDCMEYMRGLPDKAFDLAIVDPPYGMNWNTNSKRFSGGDRSRVRGDGRDDWGNVHQDDVPFDPAPWITFPRCVLFGSNHFGARLPVGTTLVWIKKDDAHFGTFLSDAELAWMKGGHGVYCFRKNFPPPSRMVEGGGVCLHPCQKPVSLMQWAMDLAGVPVGATVLDPFCGSGTTGVACMMTGRNFIGFEIDAGYCEIARKRIGEAANHLFAGTGGTA